MRCSVCGVKIELLPECYISLCHDADACISRSLEICKKEATKKRADRFKLLRTWAKQGSENAKDVLRMFRK